ncbi:TonB-linked SusC/RagA family outer membrane protein [Pedobacter sp. AK017]|nr:TonB-linked SusC/RagA family outer membrane protein [Pedobacter sp. AK017]
MKLIVIMMTTCLLQVSAASFAQKMTMVRKNTTLAQVLKEITLQTGYEILYSDQKIDIDKKIDVNFSNTELKYVLETCLKDQNLSFAIEDKVIVIKPKAPTFLERLADRWAAIDITGRVVDENGNPLPGATVKVKDGKGATMTDAQGRFLIEKVDEGATIVVSYTGYQSKEVIAKQNMGTITLKLSDNPLDQVQIIAYGTTSRRLSVSNTVTVSAKEIEQQPVNNPLLALQGRVPGMTIIPASGVPGAGITVRIQGRNNLDNTLVGSDPLIVVDGVPYASQNLKTFLGGGDVPILGSSSNDGLGTAVNFGNPLSYINPSDIESITVLKDADGTAIYGSRAANGAILITTKKGRSGNIKTDFNFQQGLGTVPKKLDLLNSQQYMEMRKEALRNSGAVIRSTDYDLRGVWDTTRYTDWQKELIGGTAQFTRLTAGVSGGSSNLQYLVSSTYGRETSVFPGNFANTSGSLHFNLSIASPNQRFKMQLGGNYMVNSNKLPGEDYTNYAVNMPPVAPNLYNADGTLNWAPDPVTGNSTWFNPLSWQYKLFETNTNNLISSGSLSYIILPGLEVKSTFGFNSVTSDQFVAALDESEKPENRADRIRTSRFSFNTSRSWIAEPQLNYNKEWSGHSISLLLGMTLHYQNNNGRGFTSSGQSSDLLLRDILAGSSLSSANDLNEYRYYAVFGRLNYSFKSKYLVNLTARRDGSSRFGPNSQFNNFGAVGLGWIISEEGFFKRSVPFISFAKIRGSYGTTGNDQIGNYRFMNLYAAFNPTIPYQGLGGLNPVALPNPNLEWEETRKLQTGIDMGVFNDRLLLTINYVRNRSSNSLTYVRMPVISGFNSLLQNLPALIENKSWEFTLGTSNIKSENMSWSSNINLTVPKNKLLAFPGLETSTLKQLMTVGQPLTTGKGYQFYGVDPLTGTYLVLNRYGDPTGNPEESDRMVFINKSSRWYGGLQNNIRFKAFSLDFLVQFTKQYGEDLLQFGPRPGTFLINGASAVIGNQPVSVMDRWKKPGDVSQYQRFSTTSVPGNMGNLAFKDLSFLRMKNVALSYQAPMKALQKVKLEQLRLYANVQNLFTITKFHGLDPESLNINSLPSLRMMTLGIQCTF